MACNYGLLSMNYGLLQGIVADCFGLLPINDGLLQGIVADCFGLIGFPCHSGSWSKLRFPKWAGKL